MLIMISYQMLDFGLIPAQSFPRSGKEASPNQTLSLQVHTTPEAYKRPSSL